MRLALTLVLILCFAQPVSADSWFFRLFGSGGESAFSERDRQEIVDYYRQRAREQRELADKYRHIDGDDDTDQRQDDKGKNKKDAKGKRDKYEKKSDGRSKDLPPGLADRAALPPGLQKQLKKNGTLPPGLAKRSLPSDLSSKLSRKRSGLGQYVVDDDVVLIEETTGMIVDIIRDVIVR